MEVFTHRIGEKPVILRESKYLSLKVRIRDVDTGEYFDKASGAFVADDGSVDVEDFWIPLSVFYDNFGLFELVLDFLPPVMGDYVFEYSGNDGFDDFLDGYERRVFGAADSAELPDMTVIYGTVRDVSGVPVPGQQVDVFLNKSGYFVHRSGLIGAKSSTLTGMDGYFEIPVVAGLDVTISIPSIGFTVRGVVPEDSPVELSSTCLLEV